MTVQQTLDDHAARLKVLETKPKLPSWLTGKVLAEWIAIPNSMLVRTLPSYALDDAYFDTDMGLPRPSQNGGKITWGTNKYGIKWAHWETMSWATASRYTESGMSFDDRKSIVYVGGGDMGWADNSYQAFDYSVDAPVWKSAVIKPTHHDNFKNPIVGSAPFAYPPIKPGDDPRNDRMYDGSHRGGHSYFCQTFFRKRNWLCHFGSHQYWPIDLYNSPEVNVADLTTGKWRTDSPIPTIIKHTGDQHPWRQKHPITEDLYLWLGNSVAVLRQDTLAYETLLTLPTFNNMRLTGSIDWDHDEILFGGNMEPYTSPPIFWTMPLKSPVRTMVTVVGPHATDFVPYRNGGLWWNPDLQKHLYYKDDGFVYTVSRSGPAEFTVDRLTMTGTAPAVNESKNTKAGGILNNFQYDFALHGMVLRTADQKAIRFFRTA